MNAAHLHLALVHIPVVVTPLACIILAVGSLRPNQTLQRTALVLFVAAGLFTLAAFLLGEGAEEIVEKIPGIAEDRIEDHEEAAELTLWLALATGVMAIVSWVTLAMSSSLQRIALRSTLVIGIVASALLIYTAWEGGEIRHPEAFTETAPTQQ